MELRSGRKTTDIAGVEKQEQPKKVTSEIDYYMTELDISGNFMQKLYKLSKISSLSESLNNNGRISYYSQYFDMVLENFDTCKPYKFWTTFIPNINTAIESWQSNWCTISDIAMIDTIKKTNEVVKTILDKLETMK